MPEFISVVTNQSDASSSYFIPHDSQVSIISIMSIFINLFFYRSYVLMISKDIPWLIILLISVLLTMLVAQYQHILML